MCKGKNHALPFLKEIIDYLGVRALDLSLLLKSPYLTHAEMEALRLAQDQIVCEG